MLRDIASSTGASFAAFYEDLATSGLGLLFAAILSLFPVFVAGVLVVCSDDVAHSFNYPWLNSILRDFMPQYYPAEQFGTDGAWLGQSGPADGALKSFFWVGFRVVTWLGYGGLVLGALCCVFQYSGTVIVIKDARRLQESVVGPTAAIGVVGSALGYGAAVSFPCALGFSLPPTALFQGPVRWAFYLFGISFNTSTLSVLLVFLWKVGGDWGNSVVNNIGAIWDTWLILAVVPLALVLLIWTLWAMVLVALLCTLANALCMGMGLSVWAWSWLPGASKLRALWSPSYEDVP